MYYNVLNKHSYCMFIRKDPRGTTKKKEGRKEDYQGEAGGDTEQQK
jgi:hypothetical protein